MGRGVCEERRAEYRGRFERIKCRSTAARDFFTRCFYTHLAPLERRKALGRCIVRAPMVSEASFVVVHSGTGNDVGKAIGKVEDASAHAATDVSGGEFHGQKKRT